MRIIVSTSYLLGQTYVALLSSAIGGEFITLRRIFFELSTFLVVKVGYTLTIAIPLASYKMIVTSKTPG